MMKRVALTLTLAILVFVPAAGQGQPDVNTLLAPIEQALSDLRVKLSPPAVPAGRVTASSLTYVRTFRLPRGGANGQSFEFSGGPIALDVTSHTLFVLNRKGFVAEVTIPPADLNIAYPFATFTQPFTDVSEGTLAANGADGIGGLLVDGQNLLVDGSVYYDAQNQQRKSHFTRPKNLSIVGQVSAFSSVWQADHTGFVAGYLARVPAGWQTALHGAVLTGAFGLPIVTRTSAGMAAFAIDPTRVGLAALVPATPLVYYPGEHPTLGAWSASAASSVYGATTNSGGLAIVDGSALFIGRQGIGENCYGAGTGDKTLAGTVESGSDRYCYDPANSSKGPHAFPYRYQVWAYDVKDFAAVAAGEKQPWELVPYAVWALDLPTAEPTFAGIGGVDYDPVARLLYVSQLRADTDGYESRAYIQVFTARISF